MIKHQGKRIPVDPEPRTVKRFELKRPYILRGTKKLFVVVNHVNGGLRAHPVSQVLD